MFGKFSMVIALTAIASTSTAGEWATRVDGPDIFGKTTVISLVSSGRQNLIVQCDTETAPIVALTERTNSPIKTAIPNVVFLLKAEGSDLIKAQGTYDNWNDNYDGASVTDPAAVSAMMGAVGKATGEIQVGLDVFGTQISASFSSRGSTKAMKQVAEHCPAPVTEIKPEG